MGARIPGVTDSRVPQSYQPVRGRDANPSPVRQPSYQNDEEETELSVAEAKESTRSSRPAKDSQRQQQQSSRSQPYQDTSISEDRPIRAAPTGAYQESDIRTGMDGGEYDDNAPHNEFPPGQHPLEGVPHLSTLSSPKDITGVQRYAHEIRKTVICARLMLRVRREQAESSGITALIGEYLVKCLFQTTAWNLREACINKVQLMLPEFVERPGMQACVVPLLTIVKIGVEDKMQQVFFSAMSLLEAVLINTKRCRTVLVPLVACCNLSS
jgi:hypothetical protein